MITLCIGWNMWILFLNFISYHWWTDYVSFFFPKIPEAYFIRDPHTFLLTQDFIKVYMVYLVLEVFFGLSSMHSQA